MEGPEELQRDQLTSLTDMISELRMNQESQQTNMQALQTQLEELTELREYTPGDDMTTRERRSAPSAPSSSAATTTTTTTTKSTPQTDRPIPCPKIGPKSYIAEWISLTIIWLTSLPPAWVPDNEPKKKTISVMIAEGLNARPNYLSSWMRIIQDSNYSSKTIREKLDILKNDIVVEEKKIAKSEFDKRDKVPDESFSEYRMALNVLAQVAFPTYSLDERNERVLERYLHGIGKIGKDVRQQAPKNLDDAILKSLAVQAEQNKQDQNTLLFTNQKFQGFCGKCGRRGHRTSECRSSGAQRAPPRGPPRFNNPQQQTIRPQAQYTFRPQPMGTNPSPVGKYRYNTNNRICYVCRQYGHLAKECPHRPNPTRVAALLQNEDPTTQPEC